MVVKINPSKAEAKSGVSSFMAWRNPNIRHALEIAFNIDRRREQIDTVEVTQEGITVRFSCRQVEVARTHRTLVLSEAKRQA